MDEISNKTLAILLIGAIVISLGGTLISLNRLARIRLPGITGFATDIGGVNLSITGVTEVNWTTDDIYWGPGTVTTGTSTCTLTSYDGNTNCTTFGTVSSPLVLENIGNTNVTLNITCGKTAATFIGHADAVYHNKEPGSCPGLAISAGAFQTASTDPVVVCNSTGGGFLATDGSDTMNFDVRVVIPSAAPSGSKTSTFTATATEN